MALAKHHAQRPSFRFFQVLTFRILGYIHFNFHFLSEGNCGMEGIFIHNDDSNYWSSEDEGCSNYSASYTCDHRHHNQLLQSQPQQQPQSTQGIKCNTFHRNCSKRQQPKKSLHQPPTDPCLHGCPHSTVVDETSTCTLTGSLAFNQVGPSPHLNMVDEYNVHDSTRTFDVTEIQFTPCDIEYRGEGNSSIVVSLVKVSTFKYVLKEICYFNKPKKENFFP